ncbi:hypothetical protein NLX69_02055 [Rossellomorea sp. BNER]|nr:hypothetical protein [Rossellomorea sp. BNER]
MKNGFSSIFFPFQLVAMVKGTAIRNKNIAKIGNLLFFFLVGMRGGCAFTFIFLS